MLNDGQLIAAVLAVTVLEVLVLVVWPLLAPRGRYRGLLRQMLPGTAAGLFLTLALLDLHTGGHWLPVWLVGAGAAHALDWWQRLRRGRPPAHESP